MALPSLQRPGQAANGLLAWQLPASAATPGLKQAETGLKRKRTGTAKYKQGREDGDTTSIGLTVSRR